MNKSIRKFYDLPLGTRFRYVSDGDVWVVLERHGCGLIAKWDGADGPVAGQSICSFEDTEAATRETLVFVCELQNSGEPSKP